jgi:hypothetical protein
MNCGKSKHTVYYTYYAYENDKGIDGKGYIGFRKCPDNTTPEEDDYYGSPSSPKNQFFKTKKNKSKIILGLFDNSKDALSHEIYLHHLWKVDINPHFANAGRQTSNGFYCEIAWNRGLKTPAHIIEKLKESHLRENLSLEARQNMSEGQKGKTVWNKGKKGLQEAWNKDKKGYGKKYEWHQREKDIYEYLSCREMLEKYPELHGCSLNRIIKGTRKQHKGWYCVYDNPQQEESSCSETTSEIISHEHVPPIHG